MCHQFSRICFTAIWILHNMTSPADLVPPWQSVTIRYTGSTCFSNHLRSKRFTVWPLYCAFIWPAPAYPLYFYILRNHHTSPMRPVWFMPFPVTRCMPEHDTVSSSHRWFYFQWWWLPWNSWSQNGNGIWWPLWQHFPCCAPTISFTWTPLPLVFTSWQGFSAQRNTAILRPFSLGDWSLSAAIFWEPPSVSSPYLLPLEAIWDPAEAAAANYRVF